MMKAGERRPPFSRVSPEAPYEKVAAANASLKLFKGKIGIRDMGRLVFLAGLLPDEIEA
jgi:hypothetical protein